MLCYAIMGVIQLLCLQNESIQRDKFPMHLKNDASFPSGHKHDGAELEAVSREKKTNLVCVLEVTDNCS